MSLLPENASFEEKIAECYLAHRGAGLMLSALDMQLLMAWSGSGAPVEVVARGIRRAAERALWDARPGEPALRSLRACKREVEAEIRKWQKRAAGRGEVTDAITLKGSLEEDRWKKAKSAVTKLGREQPGLHRCCERLLAGPLKAPAPELAMAERIEELVHAALIRALPWEKRRLLYREAASLAGGQPLGSARARILSKRFHRHALVARALALPAFW